MSKLKVGDLVQEWLTEKTGVVIQVSEDGETYLCLWNSQGLSMDGFGPGTSEWVGWKSLEVLSEH